MRRRIWPLPAGTQRQRDLPLRREVQLDNLTRYEFTCPCCDFEAHGRTNLEDPEITVPCKCGNPVTMKWDRNKRMYHE